MGWFSKLVGGSDDAVDVPAPIVDQDARRDQLDELEAALTELIRAMADERCPITNPGWQGKIRDLVWVRGEVSTLSTGTITHDGLYDLMLGVRPVFAREVPDELAFIGPLQERVLSAVREMQNPLPTERRR